MGRSSSSHVRDFITTDSSGKGQDRFDFLGMCFLILHLFYVTHRSRRMKAQEVVLFSAYKRSIREAEVMEECRSKGA